MKKLVILYRHKEEHQRTVQSKAKDQKAICLTFPSVNEKQSHEIPIKRIHINCRFEKEKRIEKLKSDLSLKISTKEFFLKDSQNYFQIILSRRAKMIKIIRNFQNLQAIRTIIIFPTYKIVPLKGYKLGRNKETGKENAS